VLRPFQLAILFNFLFSFIYISFIIISIFYRWKCCVKDVKYIITKVFFVYILRVLNYFIFPKCPNSPKLKIHGRNLSEDPSVLLSVLLRYGFSRKVTCMLVDSADATSFSYVYHPERKTRKASVKRRQIFDQ
jgi:hypothetical protein